ncbi:MAG: ASCH domain-containing protein [Planctomycetaceae bacterium]
MKHSAPSIDPDLIALGIRQPWAELILQGIKTIEVRSLETAKRGTILIYASKKLSSQPSALEAAERHRLDLDALPKGVLVGTVEIRDCSRCTADDSQGASLPVEAIAGKFAWRLGNSQRFPKTVPVRFLPYGVWFYPFKRRNRE